MIKKLTREDVNLILELHEWKKAEVKRLEETASAKALAEKFGVHVRTIEKVLQGRSWGRVNG